MADTTPQQYRTIAKTTQVIGALILIGAAAVFVVRVVTGRPISGILPALLLLVLVAAGLLVISGVTGRKASETGVGR